MGTGTGLTEYCATALVLKNTKPSAFNNTVRVQMRPTCAIRLFFMAMLLAFVVPAAGQSLDSARQMEAAGNYSGALKLYKAWLSGGNGSGADRRYTKIKLPVLEEAVRLGGGGDLDLYLVALSARADKNISQALGHLNRLLDNYANSRLRDDSIYLIGYIQLMDHFDFPAASKSMARLQREFQDSRYFDSALYSQAIAEEQLGNTTTATKLFNQLRDRHTFLSVDLFGFALAKQQVNSRYWFDRSDQRLKHIELTKDSAAKIVSRTLIPNGKYKWRLTISSAGEIYTVLLNPSDVIEELQISDVADASSVRNDVELLSGVVDGVANSWVRVTVEDGALSGIISIDGRRQPLIAAATSGTLGYYNPLLRRDVHGNRSSQHADALRAPQRSNPISSYLDSIRGGNRGPDPAADVIRIVRMGVVIDSQFNDYHGGRGFHKALSILNTADGIFQDELGVALHIESVSVIKNRRKDPMNIGDSTIKEMLNNFRRYRRKNSKIAKGIEMATLFSGNKNNDVPMGLAWIGTLCRRDGYDVSVVTPFSEPGLLAAHEIAHTLGAPHDYETSCGESGYIMSRHISRGTLQAFSSCSRQAVANYLESARCKVY